ncbi:MAG: MarR family winged helix-turn-helix transcriptional regulator [Mangrovibacterium sp.]
MKEINPRTQLFSFILKEAIRSKRILADMFLADGIDLKVDQYIFLELIHNNPNMTQQDISDELNKDKTIVLRQVKSLIDMGYVERETDEADGRKKNLIPTAAGTASYQRAVESAGNLSMQMLDSITDNQIKTMLDLFDKLAIEGKA